MPIIPTYEAHQPLDAAPTPQPRLDDSIGAALTRVGTATMAAGERWQEKQKQQAAFDAETSFSLLNENLNQKLIEAERNAPPDGRGLHDKFMSEVANPAIDQALSGITDPEIRKKAMAKAQLYREKYANDSANTEWKIGNAHDLTQIEGNWTSTAQGISQNPAAVKSYVDEMTAYIDNAPNLTPAQKAEAKDKITKAAPSIVAEALQTQDPELWQATFGKTTGDQRLALLTKRLVPAVQGAENGAMDPSAVSPDGAIGLMQVTLDTAETIAREIGDRAFLQMSKQERIAFLMQPDSNVRYGTAYLGMMVKKYDGDVVAALIAYNAGPGNADKWLEAGRDYSVLPRRGETEPYVQKVMGNLGATMLASGKSLFAGGTGARIPIMTGTQPGRQPLELKGTRPELIDRWEQVQGAFGRALPVVSANRDATTNAKAGGAQGSQHLHGNALDIDVSGLSKTERVRLIQIASSMGFTGIGVYQNSLHFDMRGGGPAMWGPTHHGDSVPPWAYVVRAEHMGGKIPARAGMPAGGGTPSSGFISSAYAGMPASEMLNWQQKAANFDLISKDQQKIEADMLKVQTSRTMADDIASITASGKGSIAPGQIDDVEQQIVAAHGVDKLIQFREDRLVAQNVFDLTQQAGQLPEEQLQQRVEQLKPKGGEGAAIQQRIYEGVKTNVDALIAERKKDPSQAAIDHFPEVADAWSKVNPADPATTQAAIRATIDAQKVMGIAPADIVPLPAPYAKTVADQVRNEETPVDTRVNVLMNTVFQSNDPAQQEQIIRQLAKNGLPISIANVAEAYQRGDLGATRRLFQAAMLDPSKTPKLGANDNTLSTAVEDAMLGPGSIGQAFYGLDLGDPKSGDVAASDLELAKAEARLLMAGGTGQDDAIAQAVKDLFGPVEVLDEGLISGGQVRGLVDEGTDKEALLRGFDAATNGKMVDVMQGYIARAYGQLPTNATPQMQAIFRASHINEMNRVLGQGVWRNTGRGWGFYDPEKQGFVSDDTGKAITFTTDELIQLGQGSTAPTAPPAEMLTPGSILPPPGDSGMGVPTAPPSDPPTIGKQGMIKAPATDPVGKLKEQGQSLLANGPLKDPAMNPALGDVAQSQAGLG